MPHSQDGQRYPTVAILCASPVARNPSNGLMVWEGFVWAKPHSRLVSASAPSRRYARWVTTSRWHRYSRHRTSRGFRVPRPELGQPRRRPAGASEPVKSSCSYRSPAHNRASTSSSPASRTIRLRVSRNSARLNLASLGPLRANGASKCRSEKASNRITQALFRQPCLFRLPNKALRAYPLNLPL